MTLTLDVCVCQISTDAPYFTLSRDDYDTHTIRADPDNLMLTSKETDTFHSKY